MGHCIANNELKEKSNLCIDLAVYENRKKFKEEIEGRKKIIMLDYDGTLTPIVSDPSHAILSKSTLKELKKIQARDDSELIIVSGRPINFITEHLKELSCYLACEHGALFYDYKKDEWHHLVSSDQTKWYERALKIIEAYTQRTPHSFFEKKQYAITWHYRNSSNELAKAQAKELISELKKTFHHLPVSVILGKKVVEIKSLEANKGYFSKWFLSHYASHKELVLAMGDDRTDEDLFSALREQDMTIKVGDNKNTHAKFYLSGQSDVEVFLKEILG